MPGAYLAAILVSAAGVMALDARFRLALFDRPGRAAAAVAIGTAFFLVWDATGIALGVFVLGTGGALLGVEIAPEMPLEEPVFLVFLSYLALVLFCGWQRFSRWRRERSGPEDA